MIERFKDNKGNEVFALHTDNTSYIFRTMKTGQLEHLHYGRRVHVSADTVDAFSENRPFSPGNSVVIPTGEENPADICLDDICLEYSSYGRGDFRDAFISYLPEGDGEGVTLDFVFESADILPSENKKSEVPGNKTEGQEATAGIETTGVNDDRTASSLLPLSYGWDCYLIVALKETRDDVRLYLHYAVYEKANVITRRAVLFNSSKRKLTVKRLYSMQLDFDSSYYEKDYAMSSFNGAWTREMHRNVTKLGAGRVTNSSVTGSSSNYANPFVMLHPESTTENDGEVYGFNLIYSGNHEESVSVSPYRKLRFLSGINPEFGLAALASGETFETPEAVMSYSSEGFNGLSRNMHGFVNEHIVRGTWKKKDRPVLLNSWEAAYFDINESKLVKLAKKAKECGIELFVMDDGWFGKRDNDKTSLGDWHVNKKKLPGGLAGLSEKIHGLGLKFGIWVEPEMVNTDSELYYVHPDWALEIPGRNQAEGRNQRLLNLSKKEVRDYLFDSLSAVFKEGSVDYVKWDYNRNYSDFPLFCDVKVPHGLKTAPAELATAHACILGLYELMGRLTAEFPNILFEGCAAGGNRFDLGILSFFPQIWASDDTDPIMRADIQTGYSYGYPQSCFTGHVSSAPNHQTLRATSLDTRFNVACFTPMGYELNLADMKSEDLKEVSEQVALYKKYRHVLQYGQFYRVRHDNVTQWVIVSEDRKNAVALHLLEKTSANHMSEKLYVPGLLPDAKYRFTGLPKPVNIKIFGDLINTMIPVHIRQDSLMHDLAAKLVKMNTKPQELIAYGDTMATAGVKLNSAYVSTGYNEVLRLATDFSSELYFAEKI